MNNPIDDIAKIIVNQLFKRLVAINPAFKQSWPTEEEFQQTKKEWVVAFKHANISSLDQIKKGLDRIRLDPNPFIPSPGAFLQLCKPTPEDIGAPCLDNAYTEACLQAHPQSWKKDWSHFVVRYAALRTGNQQFLSGEQDTTYKKFKEHYLEGCQAFADGKIREQVEHHVWASEYHLTEEQLLRYRLERQAHYKRLGMDIPKSYDKKPANEKYEFARPGILKQYADITTRKEAMAAMDEIFKKNPSPALQKMVRRMHSSIDILPILKK